MIHAMLLAESLRLDAELVVPDLRVTRIRRRDVSAGTVASQPDTWTFLELATPDERAEELAEALAAVLREEDGWYADFTVGPDHVVVFAGRWFRYRRGDTAAREEVVTHARAVGTPEHQLDWGE